MGTVCTNQQKPLQNQQETPQRSSQAKIIIHQTENQRVNQLKQFLTLTSQNTCSLYEQELKHFANNHSKKMQGNKKITDFKVIRSLGKGSFGQVFMVKDQEKNLFYAMKIINKNKISSQQDKINTLAERYILEGMDHPFIVKLHYAFQNPKKLYLLVDLMSGGQLFYLLRKNKKFPEQVAKFYAAQILLALQYLHSRNIIYRDLKPQNILLDQQGHIRLTDFGLSKVCYSEKQITYSICGTPQYIAPQIITGKGYTQTADWFSFGSLLYDMLTGKPPFYSQNKAEILKRIASKQVPIPQHLSGQAQSLLRKLFKIKPKQRLGDENGAQQIKSHPFFAGVDFKQLYQKRIKPPISFKQYLNQEGFDKDFKNSLQSSAIQRTLIQKGLVFDGFTYCKQQNLSPSHKKTQINSSIEEITQQNKNESPQFFQL